MYTVALLNNTLEEAPDLFVINMTSYNMTSTINIGEIQIGISYRGKAYPPLVCNLTVTEYSLNNKEWYPMTLIPDSDVNDIPLTNRWDSFLITWDVLTDINVLANNLYNRPIWVRLKATSGNKETIPIAYQLYFENPIKPIFKGTSEDKGRPGYSILEQAPKVF